MIDASDLYRLQQRIAELWPGSDSDAVLRRRVAEVLAVHGRTTLAVLRQRLGLGVPLPTCLLRWDGIERIVAHSPMTFQLAEHVRRALEQEPGQGNGPAARPCPLPDPLSRERALVARARNARTVDGALDFAGQSRWVKFAGD